MVVGRSYGVALEELVVEATMEVAYVDSPVFRVQQRSYSDASSGLTQLEAHLVHTLADYSKEDRMVVVDARSRTVLGEHERTVEMMIGSKLREKNCARMEMLYSARMDAVVVVLDP